MLPPSIPPSLTIVFLSRVVFLSHIVLVQLRCEHGLIYLGKDAFSMPYEKKFRENITIGILTPPLSPSPIAFTRVAPAGGGCSW